MSFRKRLVFFLVIVLVLGGLDALCAPFFVAHGVRFWILWAAKKHHLAAEIGEVDAPFLREVTIRNLRVTSAKGASSEVAFNAATVVVDLNIRGWVLTKRAHLLRSFETGHFAGSIRVSPRVAAAPKLDWRLLAQLLPDNFRCDHFDLDLTTATSACHFRDVVLTASAIESGKFLAREISVTSPFLRQTFANLRGATSWEAGRLTIAGIPLVPGLDLEALTIDLSQLARRRLGIDLHLDTYGGTLRASFQGRAGDKFAIDVAGSASNISLAQFSQAVGFLEPITGAVRASKFTFRGNPGEFLDATASVLDRADRLRLARAAGRQCDARRDLLRSPPGGRPALCATAPERADREWRTGLAERTGRLGAAPFPWAIERLHSRLERLCAVLWRDHRRLQRSALRGGRPRFARSGSAWEAGAAWRSCGISRGGSRFVRGVASAQRNRGDGGKSGGAPRAGFHAGAGQLRPGFESSLCRAPDRRDRRSGRLRRAPAGRVALVENRRRRDFRLERRRNAGRRIPERCSSSPTGCSCRSRLCGCRST